MDSEELFIDEMFSIGLEEAVRQGFAEPRRSGSRLDPAARQTIVRNRELRGVRALEDLQQWLRDDDREVREVAREAIHRCMHIAYTDPRPTQARDYLDRWFARFDRRLAAALNRRFRLDKPEPAWTTPDGLRRVVALALAGQVALAALTAVLFVVGWPVAATAALVAVAAVDISEGSFSRVTGMTDPKLRWLSRVLSHVGDLLVLTGIAVSAALAATPGFAALLLAAGTVSLLGAFVRLSALQAGFRFWRSLFERMVRLASFLAYGVFLLAGTPRTGAVVTSGLLMAVGAFEIVRVVRAVWKLRYDQARFVFLKDDQTMCWTFEDESDSEVVGTRPVGVDPLTHHTG